MAYNKKDVNDITKISNILKQAADYAGMLRQRNNKQSTRMREETHKPWHNIECETKRHRYMRFKNKYRTLKNNQSLQQLGHVSKEYEKEINTSFNKYKSKIANQIQVQVTQKIFGKL